jgi:hypothetical protein
VAPGGSTLYLSAGGAVVEKFTGSDASIRWTYYLVSAGGLVGMYVENVDAMVAARYFHKDHLGSIAVITSEAGAVLERLSVARPRVGTAEPGERVQAQLGSAKTGKRRYADGSDDPAGAITSQTSRGFTGHEELADAVRCRNNVEQTATVRKNDWLGDEDSNLD